ncbi:MAG: universal stress protein [Pelosinus sp.]|nr:universal stress protein [Pelosinus sp.]
MKGSEIIVLCSKALVAYDGSDLSQKALEKAIELAKLDQAIEIEVIHVVAMPQLPHTVLDNIQDIEDVLYRESQEIMAQAQISLAKIPNYSQTYLLNGSPAQLILNHAKEYKCDLIIMGSRGLGGIKEFLGSVSHKVVHCSQIPVLIIK